LVVPITGFDALENGTATLQAVRLQHWQLELGRRFPAWYPCLTAPTR